MTRTEHLLNYLAEECAEVAQRASKANRFGLDNVAPGHQLTNAIRISEELDDLWAVAQMLVAEKLIPTSSHSNQVAKKEKIERMLALSKSKGTLTE